MEKYKEAIKRSGYLMEARIIRKLSQIGCFIDPNQCIKDPHTGKSREIDLVAEYFDPSKRYGDKIAVKTKFVMEAINNLHPIVLLNERGWSPNSNIEETLRYFVTPNEGANPFVYDIPIGEIKRPPGILVHSQYCSFTGKKSNGELMAFHPDDLHAAFDKMTSFVDFELEGWGEHTDEFWRLFFYQPVLVVAKELLLLKEYDNGDFDLIPVQRGQLEYNYYRGESPASILIDVIVESEVENYVGGKNSEDASLYKSIQDLREKRKTENERKRPPP